MGKFVTGRRSGEENVLWDIVRRKTNADRMKQE